MSSVATTKVVLNCYHVVLLRSPLPAKGDEQWCRRCSEYRFVGIVNKTEWAIVCEDCRFSRRYGQDKERANHAAKTHEENKGHTVMVCRKGL